MKFYYIVLPTVLLLSFTLIGAVNKCHKCTTEFNHEACNDPFQGAAVDNCTDGKDQANLSHVCVKYSHIIVNQTLMVRGCSLSNTTCDLIEQALKIEGFKIGTCNICTTDMCNSSTTLLSVPLLSVMAVLFIYLGV